jgi:hypothetical protein
MGRILKLLVTVFAAFIAVSLAACGSSSAPRSTATGSTSSSSEADDTNTPTRAASAACGDKTTPRAAVSAKLPAGFPTVAGWAATQAVSQGKTLVLRGAVKGDSDEIVEVRDAAVARLTAAGYRRTAGDEEPGFEADADFTGPHSGNINVRALCRDNLVVTYSFAQ